VSGQLNASAASLKGRASYVTKQKAEYSPQAGWGR
jgi:hypothetical protein